MSNMPGNGNSFWLTINKGPQAGTVYPLRGPTFTVGRNQDNYIVIDDPMVSRHHARFTWQGNSYVVEDLGSANGTWINNVRLISPALLRSGDIIGFGQDILLAFGDRPQYGNGAAAAAGMVVPYAAAPTAMAAQAQYGAAAPPPRRMSGGLAFVIGALLAAIAVAAIVVVLLLLRQPSQKAVPVAIATNTATDIATMTIAPTYTAYPTYTPIPTNSPVPTDMPTYTPYPTYTPIPTSPPTYTPYPTYTPIPTSPPTYTPYPTYTPQPTRKPVQKPLPTATTKPTNTVPPPAPYTIAINKIEPEPWGRPRNPDGCSGPYNDRDPVKRFTIEIVLTNQSNRWIPDGWFPDFYTAKGANPPSCVWYYDNTAVEPGETTYVTFATHTESHDWVSEMVLNELGYTLVICFNSVGQVVSCH